MTTLRHYRVEFIDTDVRFYDAEFDNIKDGVIILFSKKKQTGAILRTETDLQPDVAAVLSLHNVKELTYKEIKDGQENIDTPVTTAESSTPG